MFCLGAFFLIYQVLLLTSNSLFTMLDFKNLT